MSERTDERRDIVGDGPVPARVDWDAQAASFDEEPDHGLRDPGVRAAWAERLRSWLPQPPGDLLDIGCGTGSLSLLAAEQGHRATGVDRSPAMVERARAELAGRDTVLLVGDAAAPPVREGCFDTVRVRHLLWALPDPGRALLRPAGRLVLVEGVWGGVMPVGIPVDRLTMLLGPLTHHIRIERLSGDDRLWGREVNDERYAVVAMV
ncbi:class I SAM-dependent methyltransferase [Streptomyces sp. NPDC046831]|uniref:class I SAM-dependent methyltransferase n=1 Tax=Streptomyces sp. NPDC046831 TaxID=3154805 RepID=UPI0033C817F8